jgi:Rrf2 family protein
MLRLSKKTDYGLIALKHMAGKRNGDITNAREIYQTYDLPPDLIAKILQKLSISGIIRSQFGSNGGYRLAKSPSKVTLKDVVESIDGPLDFLACSSRKRCDHIRRCTIRKKLLGLDRKMKDLMGSLTLSDI